MIAKNVLYAHVNEDGKSVLIGGIGPNTITFLGSSLPASVLPGEKMLSSFTVTTADVGREALVAVVVWAENFAGSRRATPSPDFLIDIHNDGKAGLRVDLERPFVPRSGRLIQVINGDGFPRLRVDVNGEVFATPHPHGRKSDEPASIVDGNTLCKFAVGNIEIDGILDGMIGEVLARPTKINMEIAMRELSVKLDFLEGQARYQVDQLNRYTDELAQACKRGNTLRDAVCQIPMWLLPPSIRKAVKEFDRL